MDSFHQLHSRVTYIGNNFELYIKTLDIVKNKLIINYVIVPKIYNSLLIWITDVTIGLKKFETLEFICDLVPHKDYESKIEVNVPNIEKDFFKYTKEQVLLVFQIDEDENTIEHARIPFDFNLFLTNKAKNELNDIKNSIEFPKQTNTPVILVNNVIPFIKDWDEIVKRFNTLNKHSRSTQKLNEWGMILSSAYLLNPQAANLLWQEIIECNIGEKDHIRYFLIQIFRKIKQNLKIQYATNFLFMDLHRVELMCEYKNEQSCIIAYCLNKNEIALAIELLFKYYSEKNIQLRCFLYNNVLEYLKYGSEFNNITIETWYSLLKQIALNFVNKHNALDAFAEICNLVYTKKTNNDNRIIQLWLNTLFSELEIISNTGLNCETKLLGLMCKFLYLEKNILNDKEIDMYLKKICNYSPMFLKNMGHSNLFNEDEYSWFYEIFKNVSLYRQALFESSKGVISPFEEDYLNELAQKSNWNSFQEYLLLIINNGDDSRMRCCIYYLKAALQECCNVVSTRCHSIEMIQLTISTKPVYSEAFQDFDSSKISAFYNCLLKIFWGIEELEKKIMLFELLNEFSKEITNNLNNSEEIIRIRNYLESEKINKGTKEHIGNIKLIAPQKDVDLFYKIMDCSRYKIRNNKFAKNPIVFSYFKQLTNKIILKIQQELRSSNIDLDSYIINGKSINPIFIVDINGNIIRQTNMSCYSTDSLFCEYLIRLIEYYMRKKVGYLSSKYPVAPTQNSYNAIYFCHSNGNKGYYRLVNESNQKALIKVDNNIYSKINIIVEQEVDDFFMANNKAVQEILKSENE